MAGCWVNKTWESCCAVAAPEWGLGGCDAGPGYFEECCRAREAPRQIFSCSKSAEWSALRIGVIYARPFTELPDLEALRWRASECFLGSVTAALCFLALEGAQAEVRGLSGRLSSAFRVAEELVVLLLRSPISMDEVLLSGWHLGAILLFLRSLKSIEEVAGPWDPDPVAGSEEYWLLRQLEALPGAATLRVHQDLALKALAHPQSMSPELAFVVVTWSGAYLALLELWRNAGAEGEEASALLRLGDAKLREELLAGDKPRPLRQLLLAPPFVLHLLQALHLRPVVHADVSATVRRFHHTLQPPHTWRGTLPLLELHPMPMDDGVSNANRATGQVFCGDLLYFTMIAALAKRRISQELLEGTSQPKPLLRMWEVGANLGDCSLWAIHMISSWGSDSAQPQPLFDLEAALFEPISDAITAAKAAVAALRRRSLVRKVAVKQLALGEQVGHLEINIKRRSSAEASFHGCQGFQGDCEVHQVEMETLDHLLIGGLEVVDLLKIHVQGSELQVLHGAQHSLATGRFCVVFLQTDAARIGQREEVTSDYIVESLMEIFSNYSAVAADSRGEAVVPLSKLKARFQQKDQNYYVAAWHMGQRCAHRASSLAAEELWGQVFEQNVEQKRADVLGRLGSMRGSGFYLGLFLIRDSSRCLPALPWLKRSALCCGHSKLDKEWSFFWNDTPAEGAKRTGLDAAAVAEILRRDLAEGKYILTGNLTSEIFSDECRFVDPNNAVDGLAKYKQALGFLFDPSESFLELRQIEGDGGAIRAEYVAGGVLKLPWRPRIAPWSGKIVYTLNSEGLIASQVDEWNITRFDAIRQTFTP
ncbi:unnamed protein product [Effrenium voratum]|uniref:Methyltransferase FkbM domain-containing protein n=1 Tax=Effrenium voratum TaxID=2562239 RepID=A0AA36JEF0_9DINO|nr:unnamed protein product [Effrenium voratum]